jgi:hypothetical protein
MMAASNMAAARSTTTGARRPARGVDPTASYVLTYALAKQKLLITGYNKNPSNWLSSEVVSNAIWLVNFNLVCGGFDTNQLMAEAPPIISHIDLSVGVPCVSGF